MLRFKHGVFSSARLVLFSLYCALFSMVVLLLRFVGIACLVWCFRYCVFSFCVFSIACILSIAF